MACAGDAAATPTNDNLPVVRTMGGIDLSVVPVGRVVGGVRVELLAVRERRADGSWRSLVELSKDRALDLACLLVDGGR